MKQNDFFDLTKYFLAHMIVAIHMALFPNILFPWLRIAVPLFYIISSYLLFSRINETVESKKREYVKRFVVRNLKYYLFWLIVLLPYTIYVRREWSNDGLRVLIRKIVTNTMFSSTFPASWYIVASMWAVIILYITRKINWKIVFSVLVLVYITCCLRSGYYFLIKENRIIESIIESYEKSFTSPVFSFPIATFWMFIGKLFAEHKLIMFNRKKLSIAVAVFAAGLWAEWKVTVNHGGDTISDCFFLLAPLCISIFALIKDFDVTVRNAKQLREISAVMYPSHNFIIFFTTRLLAHLNIQNRLITYFVVIVLCHVLTFFILRMEKKKCFNFLNYSH